MSKVKNLQKNCQTYTLVPIPAPLAFNDSMNGEHQPLGGALAKILETTCDNK